MLVVHHVIFILHLASLSEKPKLIEEPPGVISLGIDGIVPAGRVHHATYVEWYTNAEKLSTNSFAYEILKNNSLQFKLWSSSLAGFYQILYHNEVGLVARTIRVDIPNGTFLTFSKYFESYSKFLG